MDDITDIVACPKCGRHWKPICEQSAQYEQCAAEYNGTEDTVPLYTHAKPADTNPEPLYRLLASAWYYGNWKAETNNEREMQQLMEQAGWWPITEDRLIQPDEIDRRADPDCDGFSAM